MSKLPKGFERVGVDLPPSVVAIVKAAGGETHMPRAMASIVGALPWIAAALYDVLDEESYRAFRHNTMENMKHAMRVIEADDVREEFDRLFAEATQAVKDGRAIDPRNTN